VVGEIIAVPIGRIDVGERLRPVDPVWAAALGAVMAAEGQQTPIEVCRLPGQRRYQLVSGGHRLEGARLAGLKTIQAVEVGNSAMERRAREVAENLWRKGLDPVDRAAFVAELYALQKARAGLEAGEDGRKVAAEARWAKALKADAADASVSVTLAYGWAEGVADQIGLSRKTIYRDLELHRGLAPDVLAALRGLPIATNAGQLRALARMSADDQRAVAELITSGAAKTPAEAADIIHQRPKPAPEAKAWSAFIGGWSRMSAAMKRQALRELENQGLPKGVTLTFTGDAA
jgi:ParB-like chromosome segregation protein Spo0J